MRARDGLNAHDTQPYGKNKKAKYCEVLGLNA